MMARKRDIPYEELDQLARLKLDAKANLSTNRRNIMGLEEARRQQAMDRLRAGRAARREARRRQKELAEPTPATPTDK